MNSSNAATSVGNYKFHPLADIFPLLEGAEFDALVADIKANGLREKIDLYQGKIVDGRNRYRALRQLGIDPSIDPKSYFRKAIYARTIGGEIAPHERGDKDDYVTAYIISKNIHRRHLTPEQKRDLIAKLLKTTPEKSDRQIAKAVKASPTFVGKVRTEKEATGEVSTVDTRIDAKGVKQPAKKGWSRERWKQHRARRNKLKSERDAARRRQEDDLESLQAEAALLALRLTALDRDLAWKVRALLMVGGECDLMDALGALLDSNDSAARAPAAAAPDDGLDIPECLRRSAS